MDARAEGHRRWALVLAGGEGTRLRSVTRRIAGDDRPKQFCPLLGGDTAWEQMWTGQRPVWLDAIAADIVPESA